MKREPTAMKPRTRRTLAWAAAATALALVFAAYTSPHLARTLADQIWACF